MRDASFDDHRAVAERQAKIVEGIELQRERGFNLHPAVAHLEHGGRLKDHYLALQGSREFDSLGIPLPVAHWVGIIA